MNEIELKKRTKDFAHPQFWLEFMIDENLLKKERTLPLFNEAKELTAIFIASGITLKKSRSKSKI